MASATFIDSTGVRINYEKRGTGSRPVVMVHGFAAALGTWHDIAPFFPPEMFTLYLVDLKGFGSSGRSHDGGYSLEEQTRVLAAFVTEQDLRDVVLIGHSLGGSIALLLSLSPGLQETISRLVLIAPAAYPQPLPRGMQLLKNRIAGRAILHLLPLRFMILRTLRQVFHDQRAITEERIARYTAFFRGPGLSRVFVETCRALTPDKYRDTPRLFLGIAVPTLIIWGDRDRIVPARFAPMLQRDIPGSELVILQECGHIPHEERPGETWRVIARFLGIG